MKAGWKTVKLGEACHLLTGGTPSRQNPEYFGGDIRWLVSGDVNQKQIFECEGRITTLGLENSNARLLPKNSVMIALAGQGKTRGTVAVLRIEATCNQSMVCMAPKDSEKLLTEFLYYNLHARYQEIRRLTGDDGNDRRGLNMGIIYDIEIPLPPLAEQKRIVALLDEAFAGIDEAKAKTEEKLRGGEALAESYLEKVFSEHAAEWCEKTLGQICVVDWGNTDLTKSSYVEGGKFLAVSAAGCDGRIGHMEHVKHTPVLSAIGAQCGRMFLPEENFTAIKNTITLTPLEGGCSGKFLYRLLTHVELPKRGAAQPFIAKGDIVKFKVSIPKDIQTQTAIAQALDLFEAESRQLSEICAKQKTALNELQKSILSQAFAGELTA